MNISKMKFRFYQKSDYPAYKNLCQKTGLYIEPLDSERRINMLYEHDKEAILFAEVQNNLIGCVLINDYKWEAMIYHLAVLPEHQNQGIGSKLMEEAERILKDKGQEYITLLVSVKDDKLNKYYEKRGYKLWAALNDRRKKL